MNTMLPETDSWDAHAFDTVRERIPGGLGIFFTLCASKAREGA
ncbi:MAG: hypothetical protein ACUVT7_04275 [Thermoplasmata archaeon]